MASRVRSPNLPWEKRDVFPQILKSVIVEASYHGIHYGSEAGYASSHSCPTKSYDVSINDVPRLDCSPVGSCLL